MIQNRDAGRTIKSIYSAFLNPEVPMKKINVWLLEILGSKNKSIDGGGVYKDKHTGCSDEHNISVPKQ